MPSVQVYVNRKLSDVQKHGAASCIIREISDKLASAITDAAHRETGVPIGDIRVEFRSYIPDSTYYTGANTEALQ